MDVLERIRKFSEKYKEELELFKSYVDVSTSILVYSKYTKRIRYKYGESRTVHVPSISDIAYMFSPDANVSLFCSMRDQLIDGIIEFIKEI